MNWAKLQWAGKSSRLFILWVEDIKVPYEIVFAKPFVSTNVATFCGSFWELNYIIVLVVGWCSYQRSQSTFYLLDSTEEGLPGVWENKDHLF